MLGKVACKTAKVSLSDASLHNFTMVSSARRQDSATRLSRAQAVKNALLFHLHVSFAVSHVRLRGKSANKQQNAYNNNKIKNHSSRKKLGELATNLIQIPSTSSL